MNDVSIRLPALTLRMGDAARFRGSLHASPIRLSDFEGPLAGVLSHPADFTPVRHRRNLFALAKAHDRFAELGCVFWGFVGGQSLCSSRLARAIHELFSVDIPSR